MERNDSTTKLKSGKHLTDEERQKKIKCNLRQIRRLAKKAEK